MGRETKVAIEGKERIGHGILYCHCFPVKGRLDL
jgi:hypothetical protein